MKKFFKILLILIITVSVGGVVNAAKLSMSVEYPRGQRSIGVGDAFHIEFVLENAENVQLKEPANVPGCRVLYFGKTGNSSSITIINGKTTQKSAVIYTLTLRAEKEGTYSFGPISAGNLKSNKVTYIIGKSGSGTNGRHSSQQMSQNQQNNSGINARQQDPDKPIYIGTGDNELFMRASVSKTTAYEQEALVYTVKLYSTYDGVRFIGAASAPTFDGFVVEESNDISKQFDFETYNGKSYATAVIAKYIIFPQMSGELKISGNTYTVSVDARDYFHDPFWGQMAVSKPVQLNAKPNDLTVEVKALPIPKPANFSGGVGKFSITSQLPKKDLKTNQAASIIYKVAGTGNLKYVKLPDLNNLYPKQLEVYSPTTEVNSHVTGNSTAGDCRFDYSFMPLEMGTFTIPQVELVYFNPESEKYESSKANGYNVFVTKGEVSANSQVKDQLKFIDDLQTICETNVSTHKLLIRKITYWLWYIIPVSILCGIVVFYRRRLKELADIDLLKSKKANKVARKRLRKAAMCLTKKEVDKFYDEMLNALWGYISDKLGIPTSELNRDNVSNSMLAKGTEESVVSEFILLLDKCEFAKYASSIAENSMSEVYDNGCVIIDKLENSIKKRGYE